MPRTLLPDHPAFPPALHDLVKVRLPACPALHVKGAWPPPPGIAVVGTREPSAEALTFTRSLAEAVVAAGWAVWSGGARGIDAAAHLAALECGGPTVVVAPSGFAHPYPPEHAELFERAVEAGGTWLTPFPDDAMPLVPRFHARNAVLAALTLATVVVQAGARSGARSTARAARRLGRPLFVVPHAPWDERGEGCALELQTGARALAVADVLARSLRSAQGEQLTLAGARGALRTEIAPARGTITAPSRGSIGAPPPRAGEAGVHAGAHDRAHVAHAVLALDPTHQRVLDAIGQTPIHTDDLCERTALSSGAVAAALLTLTLQAVVVEAPAGFYRRSTT